MSSIEQDTDARDSDSATTTEKDEQILARSRKVLQEAQVTLDHSLFCSFVSDSSFLSIARGCFIAQNEKCQVKSIKLNTLMSKHTTMSFDECNGKKQKPVT
jgi:hypothetical protein